MNSSKQPMVFVNANLPLTLMERIKAAARRRAVLEARNVPYVEVLREALEREFPAQEVGPVLKDCAVAQQ